MVPKYMSMRQRLGHHANHLVPTGPTPGSTWRPWPATGANWTHFNHYPVRWTRLRLKKSSKISNKSTTVQKWMSMRHQLGHHANALVPTGPTLGSTGRPWPATGASWSTFNHYAVR
eukprot:gene11464-biopygen3581